MYGAHTDSDDFLPLCTCGHERPSHGRDLVDCDCNACWKPEVCPCLADGCACDGYREA